MRRRMEWSSMDGRLSSTAHETLTLRRARSEGRQRRAGQGLEARPPGMREAEPRRECVPRQRLGTSGGEGGNRKSPHPAEGHGARGRSNELIWRGARRFRRRNAKSRTFLSPPRRFQNRSCSHSAKQTVDAADDAPIGGKRPDREAFAAPAAVSQHGRTTHER